MGSEMCIRDSLRVFASVFPLRTFVEKVGGKHVDVRAMVRPGYSPHIYNPTPQQISALAEAVLYVRVGVPFEDAWIERIRSVNPDMRILDVRSGMELRGLEAHGHDDGGNGNAHGASRQKQGHDRNAEGHEQEADHSVDAHHHESDPHVWTSPTLVKQMVGLIRAELAELDPAHAADFARNQDTYVAELDALDRELRTLLEPLHNRKFMVFHPAWGYFAATYGLVQVPIEREGKESVSYTHLTLPTILRV